MEPTVRHCQTERRQAHITFLADLAEWKVEYQASPVETVKAFIIYTSGFDVALRNTESGLTLYVMDAQSLWGEEMPAKKRSKTALLAGAKRVAEAILLRPVPDVLRVRPAARQGDLPVHAPEV